MWNFRCKLWLLCWCLWPLTTWADITLPTAGWHLVSPGSNTTTLDTLFSSQSRIQSIWTWSSSAFTWKVRFRTPPNENPYAVLENIQPLQGYWVLTTGSVTIAASQAAPVTAFSQYNLSPKTGWQLIGTPESLNVVDLFGSNLADYGSVWTWVNNDWMVYFKGDSGTSETNTTLGANQINDAYATQFKNLRTLNAQAGFWVNMPFCTELPNSRLEEVTATAGNITYGTGYSQVSSNNQDAYLYRRTGNLLSWCGYYDQSPDDARGVAILANTNYLFVAFTVTGGNTDLRATTNAFQESYGTGGGAKITYLARVNPLTAVIESATFIGAKLTDGTTNTFTPKGSAPLRIISSSLDAVQIELTATHAFDVGDGRLTPGVGTDADCRNSGGDWVGVFNKQMQLISGDCK